jgi:hypothetical protein
MALPPPKKHWVIARKAPAFVPDYPHPECITGGWSALLDEKQKGVVQAKVAEMKKLDKTYYACYTGFDSLDDNTRTSIHAKLEENKAWEKKFGSLWLKTPESTSPPPVMPVTDNEKRVWRLWFNTARSKASSSRREQVAEMVKDNEFTVRTYIYRA